MRNQARRFRPMNIADILDETFELYRSNFLLLIGISAVVFVPYSILDALIKMRMPSVSNPADIGYLLLLFPTAILLALAVEVTTGVLAFAISERYLDKQTTILASYKRILSPGVLFPFLCVVILKYMAIFAPLFTMIFVSAMMIVAIGAGGSTVALIFVLPIFILATLAVCAFFGLKFMLLQPAYMVEMKGAGHAVSRTWTLIQGSMLKGLALIIIAFIIAKFIPAIVLWPTSMAMTSAKMTSMGGIQMASHQVSPILLTINTILTAVVNTLALPIPCLVSILLYFDIRIRKEGFDLEMLANELGGKTDQYSTYSSTASLPQEQLRTQYPQETPPPSDFEL